MRSTVQEARPAPQLAKEIEHWPLNRLIPYARNARTHSDIQVAQIAASIREFGFTNPILVDTSDGIIAGHGRLLGAQILKLEKLPVIVLDHLTETQKRAYIIADNKLHRYHRAGKYNECIQAAREALRLRPDYAEANNNIAAAYESMSQWDEAIGAAKAALRISPNYRLAKNNLDWAGSQKKSQLAR